MFACRCSTLTCSRFTIALAVVCLCLVLVSNASVKFQCQPWYGVGDLVGGMNESIFLRDSKRIIMVLNQVSGLVCMAAVRLAVQIILTLTCAIFLLSFTGCPLDLNIDKIKEDAYRQGYEQGLKDNSASRKTPTLGVPNRELPIPGKSSLPGLTPSEKVPYEMPKDFKLGRWPEDDPNYTQQLEDKIRQLELERDLERMKSESAKRDSEFWEYRYHQEHDR